MPQEINGRVLEKYVGSNYRLRQIRQSKLQKGQLSFPYLVTSVFRMDEESSDNKYYRQNTQADAQERGRFLKEIGSQSDSADSFTNIGKGFSHKLLLIFRNLHLINLYHTILNLSNLFREVSIPKPRDLRERCMFLELVKDFVKNA